MRLFWKLFCSMVLITSLACSLGGYVLIDAQFHTGFDREVAALYEENDLLRYALAQDLRRSPAWERTELTEVVNSLAITAGSRTVSLRVCNGNGMAVGGSGTLPMEPARLISQLPENSRGWELCAIGERTYLHAASPMEVSNETFYLENCREVTALFTQRQEQYRAFFYLMLVVTAAVAILSFAVASIILRPLYQLSSATKRMAAGKLDQRVPVRNDDEMGRLSADFNAMAERMETQVYALTDAAQRQEDFVNSFAHGIKTPLTSIIGYADLLRSRTMDPERMRVNANYIFSEGRRMEALSRKLMDLIVLEKQDFSLRATPMDKFLYRIGGALRPVMEGAGIQFAVRAQKSNILIEPDLMETVCLNLLDNARKAVGPDGVIVLEGIVTENWYCVRVTDNGKGIPAEELGRITEAFYMVDKSRARAQGGAGLGLAVCKKIVDLHGGKIEFESVEGKGTMALVWLRKGAAV